ncbi:MAG: hypothetical protein IKO12_08305 [Bacteroidaceae bacterium]|nr:hypothetical protein [Bacteroidaceae bacterium]
MKKFLFLLCSLLATVGAWATDINVSLSTGTFHNRQSGAIAVPVEGTKYVYAWQSPEEPAPQLTLYCPSGKNNMVIDTDVRLATDNYYLVVPAGYLIKSYSFNAYTGAASASVTPEGQDAISISTDATAPTLVEVRGLSTSTAVFAVSAGNPWMYVTDFYVTVEEDPNYVAPVYVTDLTNLSNNKAYIITNARGTWNVADNAANMSGASSVNRDDVKQQFAIIQVAGDYYLYSVNAKKYVTYDDALGRVNSAFGDPMPVNIEATDNADYPWFFKFDDAHNINYNASGFIIDDWKALDEGNRNAIIEAADFDPTEALAAFQTLDEGTYYIKNASGLYLTGANNWGTRASVANSGVPFAVEKVNGGYAFRHTLVTVNNKYLGSNLYTDSTTPAGGFIVKELEDGYYAIILDGKYLAQSTEAGSSEGFVLTTSDELTDAAKWQFLTESEATAALAEASPKAPLSATFLIKNPGFNRNISNAAWTMQASNQNLSGGTDHNRCAESWQAAFTLSQTVNVPNGVYSLTALAALTDYTDAYDGADYPVVYMNDASSPFNSMVGADRASNMNRMSDAFAAGNYQVEPVFVEVTDGTITIGVRGTRTNTWCIWDRFELTYYGPDATIEEAKASSLIQQVEDLKAQVNKRIELANEKKAVEGVSEAAVAGLDNAIAEGQAACEVADYAAAIEALNKAIESLDAANAAADQSIKDYNVVKTGIVPNNELANWTCTNTNTFHINTWSVEGNEGNDPSGMVTPFIENWVGRPGPLGEGVITYTVPGKLAAGTYGVTALVRVYSESGSDVAGATIFANDVTVDLAEAGEQFEYNGMKGTYATVALEAVVAEDGVLKIGVNIAQPTFNWVAIKDVKFTLNEPAEVDPYDAAMAAIKDGSYYTISTKVGDKDYYLTAEGTLTDDAYSATAFHFVADTPADQSDVFKSTGWNLGYNFTNPATEDNLANGQFLNEGFIRRYTSSRDDYERQVFFYNGEAYAIRATNKYKGADKASEWGANTFWTAIEGELPTAGYTLEQEYRWNLTEIANPELQDLRNEIVEAIAESQNTEGIGDYLFQKSAAGLKKLAEVAEAQKAVADNANATKEQIAAAQKALQDATLAATNLPEEGSKFTLQLKGYGIYASFNEQNKETGKGENLAGFSAEPVEFTWTSADNGAYYLTDGTHYLGFAADWNVSNNDVKGEVTFEAVTLEDGVYYYIHTPASAYRGNNSLLGASASKVEAGYRIFSDKKTTDPTLWILSPNEAVVADPYEAALAAIEDGANYSIFTEVDGEKYYLTDDGYLTAEHKDAGAFTFQKVTAASSSEFGAEGFKLLDKCFTNPDLASNTEATLNSGHIRTSTQATPRNDWEAQVFLLQNGKYAVRATNAPGADSSWGLVAKAYWTVNQGTDGPVAEYSFDQNFIWQLEKNTLVEIACNLVEDGNVTATETVTMAVGIAPTAPASFNSDKFHGLYAFTPDVKVVAENTTAVNFTPAWAGPFQFSTDEVTNWYNMDIRSGWQVAKQETEPYTMKQNATAEEKATPEFQWAFLPVEGEPCQVIVLNRAAKGQSLTKVEAADAGKFDVVMRDGEYKWEIFANGNGFVLREIGSENMWVNQDGGGKPESPLRFWNNANGKTDGGSTFCVEFVEAEENAPEGTTYEGILVQTLYAPGGASVMGTTTTEHAVTVTPVDDYHVNVTVPAFQLPVLPIGVKDVTFENVMAVKTGNMVRYIWEGSTVSVQNGMMVMNYNATFEGAQTSADATPVFHFTVGQAWNDDIYFGADEAAIEAYKNPVVEPEKESPYGFWGADVAATDVNGGDYYLYNIGTKQFLTGSNSWGTQASRNDVGTRFTVAELEDGTFTLDSHISNGGNNHFLGNGGYVDAAPFGFTLTKVEDETEGVSIYTIGDGTSLYVANAENTIVEFKAADATDPMAQWMLVNKSERLKLLAKATPENPVDATFMILCSDFGRNDQYLGEWNGAPARGGNNDNQCAEKWNTNFDIYQVVKWIPAGQYEVSVQGFYRAGYPDTNTDAQNAFLYANGVETPLMAITAEGQATQGGAYNTVSNGVYVPNSMNEASTIFTAGGYAQNKLITTVYDLTMTLGVKKSELIDGDWTIFDNFRIKYLGYDEPTTLAAAKKAYDAKVAEAKEIEATLSSDGIAIIDEALEANNDAAYTTSWEYAIAVNNIQDAITKATAADKEDLPVATSIDGIMAGADNQSIYDLSGRKVAKVQKGIYIVNGKKVAVK